MSSAAPAVTPRGCRSSMPGVESVGTVAQRVHRSAVVAAVSTAPEAILDLEAAAVACQRVGGKAGRRVGRNLNIPRIVHRAAFVKRLPRFPAYPPTRFNQADTLR
jgi:hypothetical protein